MTYPSICPTESVDWKRNRQDKIVVINHSIDLAFPQMEEFLFCRLGARPSSEEAQPGAFGLSLVKS